MDQLPGHKRNTGMARRLYDMLRTQMADGRLCAGAAVPSTRALATELGVSRTTVVAVYEQLAAEGFLLTAPGKVARVASLLAQPCAAPESPSLPSTHAVLSRFGQRVAASDDGTAAVLAPVRHDFLYGAVSPLDFPLLAWRRAYQAELLRQPSALYYAPPEGDDGLRRALQGYLWRARGLVCDASQIVIVQGSQQGIDLCCRMLLDPGDAAAVEDPGYLIARRTVEAYGARALPVPVDAQGLDPAGLPRGAGARLAFVTPSHQFPLGGVLPVGRRQALLAWARGESAWILEDDYDGEFRYGQRPIDALQSLDDDGRVIYLGTFSKSLSPQLRLGYLVLPPALASAFARAKRLADRHAPLIEQRALAHLIDTGVYERHVRRMRRLHERRRTALLDAIAQWLPQAQVAGTAAGLHVVLWLPDVPASAESGICAAARQGNVGIYPLSPLYAVSAGASPDVAGASASSALPAEARAVHLPTASAVSRPAGFVLGYASQTPAAIREGIACLAAALRDGAWPDG